MGRHSTPTRTRRTPAAAAAAALLLVGLGGYGASRLGGGGSPSANSAAGSSNSSGGNGNGGTASAGGTPSDAAVTAAEDGSAQIQCAKGGTVSVSTTPDMAPALKTVADQLKSQGKDCVTYDITPLASGIQVDRMTKGGKAAPQIWVPDSSAWLADYDNEAHKSLDYGEVVATSPVGLVLPKVYIDHGVKAGAFTWASLMSSRKHAVTPAMADPEYSTATMLLFTSAQAAATDAKKKEAVEAEVLMMAQRPRDEVELMKIAASGSPDGQSFPASEQQMLAEHKANPSQKVSAVTVTDATPQFTYGVVPLATDGTTTEAANALRAALRSDAGKKVLADNGFRVPGDPSASAPSQVDGLDMQAVGTPLQDPSLQQVQSVQKAWLAVHRKMHMQLAVDESGSMLQPAAPNLPLNRIQLATKISLAALTQLPGDAEIGVWVFSDQNRGNGKPWVEVAPIAPLDSKLPNGMTQRQRLLGVAQQLPSLPHGGTALYDTIRDAVQKVQATYDPSAVNSVVVWTDGVNRDAATITKQDLLAQLHAEATSDKPVRVVLVGMGQASDMGTLQEIAQASGGSAYYALDPAAVKSIIAGALYSRIEQAGAGPR